MGQPERLKQVIEQCGISQSDFAKILGISKGQITNILNGDREISNILALAIKSEFNINPTWLLTGDGEMFLSGTSRASVTGALSNTDKYQYRLDEEEKELIDLLRSKKKGKDKIFIAVKALLGLGVLLFVFMR